ncbi:hypothetical protein LLH00_17755 [bacterium]|nr:hypothetical protein [bacterium]
MGNKLLLVIGMSCLPSLFYLFYVLFRRGRRHLSKSALRIGHDSIVQILLAALAIFCFLLSATFAGWLLFSHVPYYHLQKALVLSVLFLLLGVFCIQVLQFIRLQGRPSQPKSRPEPRARTNPAARPVQNGAWLTSGQRGR